MGTSRKLISTASNRAAATPSTASMKPQNWLPTSPMKIRARGKLNGRKPTSPAPSSMAAKYTNHACCPAASAARKPQATSATPAARPFSPSMKFIALVANRIHTSVAGMPSQPISTGPTQGRL